MKSSSNGQIPLAHYRDRHISLIGLPVESTKHGFKTRVKKTSNEDLRHLASQPPMVGILNFSQLDGSVQENTLDEITPEEPNRQRKRARAAANVPTAPRAPPSAGGHPLQVQIGPPVPTKKHARIVAPVPNHGMYYGPLSPSSDDTPLSATNPHQYALQALYPMAPDNTFGQHYIVDGGVQGMEFPGSASRNDFATFDPAYQIPFTDLGTGPYRGGSMSSGYPPEVSYPFDGYINENVYYPQEHVTSGYSSVDYPEAQITNHPNGHVVTTTNYTGNNNFPHGSGQYYYPPSFGQ